MRKQLARNARRIADLLDPPMPTTPRTVWHAPEDALLMHTGLCHDAGPPKAHREVLDEKSIRELAREQRAAFAQTLKDTP